MSTSNAAAGSRPVRCSAWSAWHSYRARRQKSTHQAQNDDRCDSSNQFDTISSPQNSRDEQWNNHNGDQQQRDRNGAGARKIHRPSHPLETPGHDRSRICLAVVNPKPLVITPISPTSFNLFSRHMHLQMPYQRYASAAEHSEVGWTRLFARFLIIVENRLLDAAANRRLPHGCQRPVIGCENPHHSRNETLEM